jgi:hypothetical protein
MTRDVMSCLATITEIYKGSGTMFNNSTLYAKDKIGMREWRRYEARYHFVTMPTPKHQEVSFSTRGTPSAWSPWDTSSNCSASSSNSNRPYNRGNSVGWMAVFLLQLCSVRDRLFTALRVLQAVLGGV